MGIRTKVTLPEPVTHDNDLASAPLPILFREISPESGRYPQQIKESCRHHRTDRMSWLFKACQIEID